MASLGDVLMRSIDGVWDVLVEASPWLIAGLFFAGLAKWVMPSDRLVRVMGTRGWVQVVRATIVGAPLPLCSCGVLPAAIGLRREGLSKAGTASFLVATPQNGADSIALSYALLGPVFTVVRVVSSLISALSAGLLTLAASRVRSAPRGIGNTTVPLGVANQVQDCCADSQETHTESACCQEGRETRTSFVSGQRYAFGRFLLDIGGWLAIGLVVAGVMNAWVDPGAVSAWASGIVAMLVIIAVSVPMYICAQASTPVAASMLAAGVSPGVVLVFLLAGPATNFASIAVVRKEIGIRATAGYAGGVIVSALALGLITDWLMLDALAWTPGDAVSHAGHLVPMWLAIASAIALIAWFTWLHGQRLIAHVRAAKGRTCTVCGERVGVA